MTGAFYTDRYGITYSRIMSQHLLSLLQQQLLNTQKQLMEMQAKLNMPGPGANASVSQAVQFGNVQVSQPSAPMAPGLNVSGLNATTSSTQVQNAPMDVSTSAPGSPDLRSDLPGKGNALVPFANVSGNAPMGGNVHGNVQMNTMRCSHGWNGVCW